jgi:acyl-CoA synthetase (AMP-forming)/AMP-acid ligase II
MRIIDSFDQGTAIYPDNIAFVDGPEKVTYREAQSQSRRIAAAIRGHGYDAGTKVGIIGPNANVSFIALLGLFRSESVWLPVNPRNATEVNVDILDRFDCELLMFHTNYADEAKKIKEQVPGIKEIVCIDGEVEGSEGFATWLEGYSDDFEMSEEDPDGLFAIFPTGGTTGPSKGVMIVHKNIETMFNNYWAHLSYYDDTHHLVVAPMTHSAGLLGCMHFARGGTNYMMAVPSPVGVLEKIQEYGITHLFLPPTVLYMMLAEKNVRDYDCSSLQHFLIGAAPCSLEKLKEAIDVFGPVMTEGFGQTEAPAAITIKAPWDYMNADGSINEARLQSIGRPAVNNEVAILDDDDQPVPNGTAGEICIRGRLVTPGYYKNPEATAEVRTNGWHHTGDVGVKSDDGFITIVDRKKDMIITGGFNVFPNEIEQVLTGHDAVQDCAVIGVPDEKWGEAVKAVIQLKPGMTCTDEELMALTKEKLGSVKAPKSVDFVEDLPRSPAGKVLKKDLRDVYWAGKSRAVN